MNSSVIDQIECYTKETNQLTGFVCKGLMAGEGAVLCSRAVVDRTRTGELKHSQGEREVGLEKTFLHQNQH